MAKATTFRKGDPAPVFEAVDAAGKRVRLDDYAGEKSVVLVFLRYAGCPLCQLSMARMRQRYGEFRDRNAEVIVFVQSPGKRLESEGMVSSFPFRVIPDPEMKYYEMYGIGSGNIFDIINPDVVVKGIKAVAKGHRQGKMEGNTWQLPGDVIVGKDGRIILHRVGKNVGDNLTVDELLKHL